MKIIFLFIAFYFPQGNFAFTQNDCFKFIQKTKLNEKVLIVGIGDAVISIFTQKGIVVIDAGESATLTGYYKKIIERESGRNDFIYLINTHSHLDHTGGNRVFSDLKIIGHNNCPVEISNYWKEPERIKKIYKKTLDQSYIRLNSMELDSIDKRDVQADICRYTASLEDIKPNVRVILPDVLFSDTMSLNMGDLTLYLIYFGKAHTTSDIIIYIPEQKLLLTGDLFVKGGNPSFKIKDQQCVEYNYNILNALLSKKNIRTIITGHGEILTSDDLNSFFEEIKTRLNSFTK
jgi:glyoxylase-like metal-dependent hydrolase (beta-lactamase superfamily II)